MIRRGFWFAAGAVAGIAGYRRASRAAKALLPRGDLLAPLARRTAGPATTRMLSAGPGSGRQLPSGGHGQAGQQNGAGRAGGTPHAEGRRNARTAQKAAAETAAFVRDVRAGMADYLDGRRGV